MWRGSGVLTIGLWLVASFSIACGRSTETAPSAPASKAPAAPNPTPATPAPDVREPAPAVAPRPTPAERGAALYAQMCAVCHGEHGEGYKADQAPMLAHPQFLTTVSNSFLRVAIAHGRPGTTMSAWGTELGGPLPPEDVIALIVFLRTWQTERMAVLDESPNTGNATRGAAIWKHECASCHAAKGKYLRLQNPELLDTASNGFLRAAIRAGRAPTTMPAFETKLRSPGIEDVVAYLRSISAAAKPKALPVALTPAPLPLGPVPLNPRGPEPADFARYPDMTPVASVWREYARKARMVILDARAPTDYATEHVAGAVSVPFYDPSPYLAKLPKNAWLVCYCGCPHAESGQLAMKLKAAGFEKVTVMDEGLWEWKDKSHPMREGPKP